MCATSIGSTCSQMPVPGVRKSGIPEGTEIPAPVSATAEPAERTSSARRATPREGLMGRPRRPRGGLLALPRRLALAEERADALARVRAREHLRERGLLRLDALV